MSDPATSRVTTSALPVVGEIDRDAALAAVGEGERGRGVVVEDAPDPPQRVTRPELELDHVGAEVAEHRGRQRPRDEARGIQDADALERSAHSSRS